MHNEVEAETDAQRAERLYDALDDAKRRGQSWPSLAELKAKTGLGKSAIDRAKAVLICRRVLLIEAEAGRVKRYALQRELPFRGGRL